MDVGEGRKLTTNKEPDSASDTNGVPIPMAYFRGRKLVGTQLGVPAGYRGVVIETGSAQANSTPADSLASQDIIQDDGEAAQSTAHITASFDKIMVWSHELAASDGGLHARSIQEWIDLAQKV